MHVTRAGELVHLYKRLVEQLSTWVQRIHAELNRHVTALPDGSLRSATTRAMLEDDELEFEPGRQDTSPDGVSDDRRDHRRDSPAETDMQRFG